MKKIFILAFGLVSLVSTAQKTIVEEKFEKGLKPVNFDFNIKENKLYIHKGGFHGAIRSTNRVDEYSISNTTPVTIFDNEKFLDFSKSIIDDSFKGTKYNGVGWAGDAIIYNNPNQPITINKDNNYLIFDKNNGYFVANDKGNEVKNIEKEELFLHIFSNKTKSIKKIKLSNLSFLNLKKENYFKLKRFAFKTFFHEKSFDIVSKVISLDTKSFILYRDTYNYEGKFIESRAYNCNVNNPLILSNNGGGELDTRASSLGGSTMTTTVFEDQLAINNFIIDPKTKEVYIYGLFGSKEKKLVNNDVVGNYIFKFDTNGNKIWEKIENINDNELLKNSAKTTLNVVAEINNNSIYFIIFKYQHDQYLYFTKNNTIDGNKSIENKVNFDVDSMGQAEILTTPILSFFKLKEYKNLILDVNTLFLQTINTKIKEHLKNLGNSKSKISFNSYYSDQGIWLIETDNKTYYKVTYFNHE